MKALSDYFEAEYKINSYYPSYISNRGINIAAQQLHGMAIGYNSSDIVVAHSLGGLVSRQFYKNYPSRRYSGLITLNSPHLGAEFARSFDNGKVESLFKSVEDIGIGGYKVMGGSVGNINVYHNNLIAAANRFGMAKDAIKTYNNWRTDITIEVLNLQIFIPGADYFGLTWLVNWFTANKIKKEIIPFVQDFVGHAVEDATLFVFGHFESGYPNTKNDLKPNSSVINSLNNYTMACPTIAIAGVEDYPAGIRMLGSVLSNQEQQSPGIGDITDNLVYDITKGIAKDSRKCEDKYWSQYKSGSWWSLGITNSYYLNKKNAFKRQAEFWENGFERAYQQCLGSIYYTYEIQEIVRTVWIPGSNSYENPAVDFPIIHDPDLPDHLIPTDEDGHWEYIVETVTITHEHMHPNDGIVTLPSQQGLQGALKKTIPSTNHEEAKRSKEVRDYLKSQFDTNPDFKLLKKN